MEGEGGGSREQMAKKERKEEMILLKITLTSLCYFFEIAIHKSKSLPERKSNKRMQ